MQIVAAYSASGEIGTGASSLSSGSRNLRTDRNRRDFCNRFLDHRTRRDGRPHSRVAALSSHLAHELASDGDGGGTKLHQTKEMMFRKRVSQSMGRGLTFGALSLGIAAYCASQLRFGQRKVYGAKSSWPIT